MLVTGLRRHSFNRCAADTVKSLHNGTAFNEVVENPVYNEPTHNPGLTPCYNEILVIMRL